MRSPLILLSFSVCSSSHPSVTLSERTSVTCSNHSFLPSHIFSILWKESGKFNCHTFDFLISKWISSSFSFIQNWILATHYFEFQSGRECFIFHFSQKFHLRKLPLRNRNKNNCLWLWKQLYPSFLPIQQSKTETKSIIKYSIQSCCQHLHSSQYCCWKILSSMSSTSVSRDDGRMLS